jgi:CubicO group peptidase (beta-lactamase class C family)
VGLSPSLASEIQRRLSDGCRDRRVPGAVLAVLDGDEVDAWATGVTNVATGVETTTDTLFQIGSITKVWTATLVMQLVDEGAVKLDAPVRTYLHDLRFADDDATEHVTIRHLLSHTSGVDGDFFEDFGRGLDAVARYVTACSAAPSVFAPGALWSYCNLGFVVLGRVVEVVTGAPWHSVLRDRLVTPLGLAAPLALAEEAIVFRTAVGHLRNRVSGEPERTSQWQLAQATAPAGGTPCASARDLLVLARMHIEGGRAQDGTAVLSEAGAEAMQELLVDVPTLPGRIEGWGLGWQLERWDGDRIVGHGGSTIGQSAMLKIAPDRRFAVAMVTNSDASGPLVDSLFGFVFGELRGIAVPPHPTPPEAPAPLVRPDRYVGTYERHAFRFDIEDRGGALWFAVHPSGPIAELYPEPEPVPLVPADERTFFAYDVDADDHDVLLFPELGDGPAPYLFTGRIAPRIA